MFDEWVETAENEYQATLECAYFLEGFINALNEKKKSWYIEDSPIKDNVDVRIYGINRCSFVAKLIIENLHVHVSGWKEDGIWMYSIRDLKENPSIQSFWEGDRDKAIEKFVSLI